MRKPFLLFTILLLVGFPSLSRGGDGKGMSIGELIPIIGKAFPDAVIGWDRITETNATIADPAEILSDISKQDVAAIRRIISRDTDYEFVAEQGCFIFLPKDNAALHTGGITKRKVAFPAATQVDDEEYLKQIKSADGRGPILLFGPLLTGNDNHLAKGPVSLKPGVDICYKVLNLIARQLKAKFWITFYSVQTDPVTKKTLLPMKLDAVFVLFSSTFDTVYM